MTDALPSLAMIAELDALSRSLSALATTRHDASLASLEEAVLATVRAALPGLLTEVVRLNTRALQAPQDRWPQSCPRCGAKTQAHSSRPRTVQTVCGPIHFERSWYRCRSCGNGFSPADTSLGLTQRSRLSAGLHAWLLELGSRTSFREAAGLLECLTGLPVSAETVRQRTERTGECLEREASAASEEVQRTGQAVEPVDRAPGTLVVETDGVMVRYLDGWHEVKLGLVAGLVEGELSAPSYLALRLSAEQFGPRLLAEATRRGALTTIGWEGSILRGGRPIWPEVVVIGDGAPWIWKLAAEHFGRHTEVVDFYHACEHLWVAARALAGEDTAVSEWAQARIRELRDSGSEPVLTALDKAQPSAEMADVLRRERGYVRTNAARMAYPAFREKGLPIGSGAIESGAKHLVQLRMKRPGARWSNAGARGVLNVRCQLLSGRSLAA